MSNLPSPNGQKDSYCITITLSAEDLALVDQISQLNQGDRNVAIHLALSAWRTKPPNSNASLLTWTPTPAAWSLKANSNVA